MTRTPWTNALTDDARWNAVADELGRKLAVDALDRDRANLEPVAELALLKESGLPNLLIPTRFGGHGGHWSTGFRAVRILARYDASIAQLLGYHFFNSAGIVFFGAPERWEYWFTASARGSWLWGDAVNPIGPELVLTPDGDGYRHGYRLNGRKRFATGASTGDVTLVMAADGEPGARTLALVLERDRAGTEFGGDWDALGQRLSASGSVSYRDVRVNADDVLGEVGEEPYSTLVTPAVQLGFGNLYLGIAQGALERARSLTLQRPGAWLLSSAERYSRDPLVQRVFGELVARTAAVEALADKWNARFDAVIAAGGDVTAADRAEVEIGIATLKVVATETALEVAQRVYEVTGASSARTEVGLDIYWRNIRTHSLHDPVDYKKVEVGANFLTGEVQPTTLYT